MQRLAVQHYKLFLFWWFEARFPKLNFLKQIKSLTKKTWVSSFFVAKKGNLFWPYIILSQLILSINRKNHLVNRPFAIGLFFPLAGYRRNTDEAVGWSRVKKRRWPEKLDKKSQSKRLCHKRRGCRFINWWMTQLIGSWWMRMSTEISRWQMSRRSNLYQRRYRLKDHATITARFVSVTYLFAWQSTH